MKVELQRTGGFAGRVVRWSVTVEDLPPPTGEELLALLTAAREWVAAQEVTCREEGSGTAEPMGGVPAGGAPAVSPSARSGGGPRSTGADRFQWRLQTSGFPQDVDLVFGEPPPEPARRLVDLVRDAPPPAPAPS